MQSNHARIKRSSGSSMERRRRERTGKADRTELTLTDQLLLNSSCEPPGPSFHAFHCGAPTPQVRDPGTPSQCGSGRSYSLRICTRFWLNARTHTRAHKTHAHILWLLLLLMGGKFDCAGSVALLPPLPPLASWWCYTSGTFLERIQPREIQSMPSFFFAASSLSLSLPPRTATSMVCQINYANCTCFAHCTKVKNERLNFSHRTSYRLAPASWGETRPRIYKITRRSQLSD